ncbi:phosphoglycerate dehydrogenase, partial [bacterium]|nr:phosphoglycerate dehydrogenase [bacterium]
DDVAAAAAPLQQALRSKIRETIDVLTSSNKQIFVFSRAFEELVWPITDTLKISRRNVFTNRLIYSDDGSVTGVDKIQPLYNYNGKVFLAESLKNDRRFFGKTAVIGNSRADLAIRTSGVADTFIYYANHDNDETVLIEADFVIETFEQILLLVCLQLPEPEQSEAEPHPYKALLLENIHHQAADTLTAGKIQVNTSTAAVDTRELQKIAADCEILGIRSKTQIRARELSVLKSLHAIGCFCIGTDQVDLKTAAAAGIPVFNAPYANTRSVAELVLGEAIMLMRGIFNKSKAAHAGKWHKITTHSWELRGKTLGIIGYGHIGSQVSILFEHLGMQVIYHDVMDKLPLGNAKRMPDLAALLQASDIVTLHVPDTEQTHGLISADELGMMKEKSILINSSRGRVVDLKALKNALESGRLVGAAVDVYPDEPASKNDTFHCVLQGLPNVILTPHIGGTTLEAQQNIALEVSRKLRRFLETGSTLGAVNFPEVDLPRIPDTARILLVHRNVPGVVAKVNAAFYQRQINIEAQILKTRDDIGYMIIDVPRNLSTHVLVLLNRITETIKVWKI